MYEDNTTQYAALVISFQYVGDFGHWPHVLSTVSSDVPILEHRKT